tara:strand:- start:1768 stop:2262 length:495 start_codon:yes stop_codon:yes gene_type:complete
MRMVPPTLHSDRVVTSAYGVRDDGPHNGVDLRAAEGDSIVSIDVGSVAEILDDISSPAGLAVYIDHDGGLQSRYMHGSAFPEGIQVGQRVEPGSVVMYAGGSGNSNGSHLHFEIGHMVDGEFKHVDPLISLSGLFDDYKIKGTKHTVESMLSDQQDDKVLRQSF